MRLSPFYPSWYLYHSGIANLWLGNLAAAREAFEEDRRREGNTQGPLSYAYMACLAAFEAKEEEAAREVLELKKRFPTFGVEDVILAERYKEPAKLGRLVEILRRAGLPEGRGSSARA